MEKQCVVVTNPMIAANHSQQVTLSKFLAVISGCYETITVIGGNITVMEVQDHVHVISLPMHRAKSRWKRITDLLLVQQKTAQLVKKHTAKGTPVYFWVADKMILPFRAAHRNKADIRYFLYGNVQKEGAPSITGRLSAKLIAYMATHADSICVESPGVLHEWEGLIAHDRVRTIHLYTPDIHLPTDRRRENVIGMLCRLTEGKRVLESIRAFTAFHKMHPEYRLEIIGSGKLEQACRELITSSNAQDYILMHGWVDHQQVADNTAHWKYLLFPTDTEGMPNSVIEMMAMGTPVIASPVGGIRDIIQHGRNGWLLPGTSVAEILTALCTAVAHEDHYLPMAEMAQAEIRGEFSLENAQAVAKRNT